MSNQYEGMCEVALKEEGIFAKPVQFPGDPATYYPEKRDGIDVYKTTKINARHMVSSKPGRYVFLGTEKHEIMVPDKDGCMKPKTFYPWKRDYQTKQKMVDGAPVLDENKKPVYEKSMTWTELTDTK